MNLLNCCCGCKPTYTVPEFTNTTSVTDYGGGANIAPYSRLWYDMVSGSCTFTPAEPGEPVDYNQGFDGSPATLNVIPGITPGGSVTIDLNGYVASGGNVEISNPCYGWKAVAALAVWPGRFGFINSGGACCPDGGQEQTKYRTVTVTVEAEYFSTFTRDNYCDGVTAATTYEYFHSVQMSQTATVDEYGNLTRSGSVEIVSWSKTNGVLDAPELNSCNIADNAGIALIGSAGGNFPIGDGIIPAGDLPLDASCGIISVGDSSTDPFHVPTMSGTVEELNALNLYAPGSNQTASDPCIELYQPEIVIDGDAHAAEFELTDTRLAVSWLTAGTATQNRCCEGGAENNNRATQTSSLFYSKEIVLSDAMTYDAVKADAVELLSEWQLLDDKTYPWRTDAQTWLVPIVKRDAAATTPTIDWTTVGGEGADACDFISVEPFTGAIRGSPNPAGYARHYDFRHINWVAGTNTDGSVCVACEESIGMSCPTPLPATATCWVDKHDGANMHGPGGWMTCIHGAQYGTGGPSYFDGVLMQKWAETIMPWPSLNHARPCARDRYLYDESAFACIVAFDGTNLEIEFGEEFEVGDTVAIEDGVYQIATKTDSENYTVGAKLYDLLTDCDGVSKLRFPTARAIASALPISSATQSSPGVVTITVAKKHWLKRGGSASDTVDFTGVAGLGSGLTATVVDDYIFTVPGTLGAYVSGGTVSSTGAPGGIAAWDTTCPRKTYVTREWQSRYREYDSEDPEDLPWTETLTERTYSGSTLGAPFIVVISPNGETPSRGVLYDFGDIDHDQCFGADWHMDVVQALNDPFWQAGHEPCGHSGAWSPATSPCSADEDHYEYPPLVEASVGSPDGAPELPAGIELNPSGGMPGEVDHPHCVIDPYNVGTHHAIREAWEACDQDEKTAGNC